VAAVAEEAAKSAEAPDTRPAWQRIPQWAYILGAGVIAVWVISMLGRFVTTEGGPWRCVWALAEIIIGVTMFLTGHIAAYLHAAIKSEKIGPLSVVFNPIEVWDWTVRKLPTSVWRLWLALWGMTAIVCGPLLVGGINYNALFDGEWVAQQEKKSAAEEGLAEAGGGSSDMSMEEAMNELNNKSGAKAITKLKKDKKKDEKTKTSTTKSDAKPAVEEEELDENAPQATCRIIGYTISRGGELEMVLLASEVEDRWQYVGTMKTDRMPPELRKELLQQLKGMERERPAIKNPLIATWVQPKLQCEVRYKELNEKKEFHNTKFKAMVEEGERAAPRATEESTGAK